MADGGEITFSTVLDNAQLEKELKQAEREIKDLEAKVSKWDGNKSALEQQMDSTSQSIDAAKAKIAQLKAEAASLPDVTTSKEAHEANVAAYSRITSEIKAQDDYIIKQTEVMDKLNAQWLKADGEAARYTGQLGTAKARAAELGTELQATAKKSAATTQAALKESEARFSAFSKRINGYMKNLFVFGLILEGLRSIKEYIGETAKENDRFAVSFANLKATMAGFAAPLVNMAVTALTGLMNMISKMIETLAGLIDSLFRTNLADSIRAAREAAQAAEREAKAKKKTAKSAKEAAKSIMAFDEINALSAEQSADKDEEQAEAPLDWNALDAGKIDEKLGAIMLILGAALMAVGAILAFSGINIPLGITLMAIGALMVYTAVQEQWGALPAELQSAITTALVITGMLLLVVGAILALSGVGVPIGVGMMAAGAVLLWTAAAINWDSMEPQLQAVVTILLAVLGAALLVIGAILCFSGAGTPLGIGLMVLGAASLAAAAALAWDSLPNELRNVVGQIMMILGGVLLVVGAILAFSGAATPLGVGLMIAGAGLLAAGAATIDWNAVPEEVRNTVTTILTIVGAALLVLGVVLLLTGAGIPLGIGCILAGIGSLVGAAAINWNFLEDKAREIWGNLTSWWDQNVAQIFTSQFWEDLWKSMVNGLIWAINSGLNAFGGFVNNISSGISGLLSMAGVDWSWSVQMPQLPYLAQGAVIPPNRKFAAVLGDQRSGNNLEAPEGLIRQIVREESGGGADTAWNVQQGVAAALMQVLPALLGGQEGKSGDLVLVVGQEELARTTLKGIESLAHRGAISPQMMFV